MIGIWKIALCVFGGFPVVALICGVIYGVKYLYNRSKIQDEPYSEDGTPKYLLRQNFSGNIERKYHNGMTKDGFLIGYKILRWDGLIGVWESPFHTIGDYRWFNGYLKADKIPTPDSFNGIYVPRVYPLKELRYLEEKCPQGRFEVFIVAMGKPIVEEETGFRANEAYIMEMV